jgi:hypothetical protein
MRTIGAALIAFAALGFLTGLSAGARDPSGCEYLDLRSFVQGLVCWGTVLLCGAFLCIRGGRPPAAR